MIEQSEKSLNSSSKFFLGLTTLFVTFMLWMWFAKVDITTQAVGYVVPESNFTSIDTMVDGQVVDVKVKQGDSVKKGDIILIINPGVGYEPYNVIANIDGRIQTLNYRNPGAVVNKGETIVLIVPADQKLIVSGKLYVKDRGYVELGQSAKIKLANQDQLKFAPIDAKIISISPDAVQSERGTWYEIELQLEQQKFATTTKLVINTISEMYPNHTIPFHSRWRHFETGGVNRWKQLTGRLTLENTDRLRVKTEVTILSVLLDGGAGASWHFKDPLTGQILTRSEGLGVASLLAYFDGAFSSDPQSPLQADMNGLSSFNKASLVKYFQIKVENLYLFVLNLYTL